MKFTFRTIYLNDMRKLWQLLSTSISPSVCLSFCLSVCFCLCLCLCPWISLFLSPLSLFYRSLVLLSLSLSLSRLLALALFFHQGIYLFFSLSTSSSSLSQPPLLYNSLANSSTRLFISSRHRISNSVDISFHPLAPHSPLWGPRCMV